MLNRCRHTLALRGEGSENLLQPVPVIRQLDALLHALPAQGEKRSIVDLTIRRNGSVLAARLADLAGTVFSRLRVVGLDENDQRLPGIEYGGELLHLLRRVDLRDRQKRIERFQREANLANARGLG